MKKIKERGFTLIELLVVIAIIGLLSTLAVIALNYARQKSRDTKRVADVTQMRKALELYNDSCNKYPFLGAAGVLTADMTDAACPTGTTLGTFMSSIPEAPLPNDGTCSAAENTYSYVSTDDVGAVCATEPCASYSISYCLGTDVESLAAGVHGATPSGL